MTPPHGTKMDDSGERDADASDQRLAHFFRCWDREGGPGYQLREQVNEIQTGFVDMTATIRTWGRAIAGAVTLLTLAVAWLGYVQARDAAKPAHVITQAVAATKGTP